MNISAQIQAHLRYPRLQLVALLEFLEMGGGVPLVEHEINDHSSTLVSGEKRIKASKDPPFAPRNPNRKCRTRRNISLNCYNTVTQYLYGLLGVTSVAWVRPAEYFGREADQGFKGPTFRTEKPKPQMPNPTEYFVELLQYRDTISLRIVRSDFRCLGQARRIFWRAWLFL